MKLDCYMNAARLTDKSAVPLKRQSQKKVVCFSRLLKCLGSLYEKHSDMVRVVDCHTGDLGSNPVDGKIFPSGIAFPLKTDISV